MTKLIESISQGIPAALVEVITLRTLKKRAGTVLAFDRPGTSNGLTDAINGRLEHLRGSALGCRNPTNYIARSLVGTAGSDCNYTLDREEPVYPMLGLLLSSLVHPAEAHLRWPPTLDK